MGYHTCYELDVQVADNTAEHPDKEAIIKALRSSNESAEYALDEYGQLLQDAKWYESSAEMKEFSKTYPTALFVLSGDGENSDDFWVEYFLDGKSQHTPCRFEYDDFDPAKLA